MKKHLFLFLAILFAGCKAHSQEPPIKIGMLNITTLWPKCAVAAGHGAELAVQEINASGGLLGRKLELIERDMKRDPAEAVRVAEELVARDQVDLLMGFVYSNTSLALGDFALHHHRAYLGTGAADSLTLEKGNRYSFIFETSAYTLASAAVEEIAKAPGTRVAIVAPNYEYGHSIVQRVKELAPRKKPGVQWVCEQYPTMGKLEAGPLVGAVERSKPDIILSAVFATDHAAFVREGAKRELFKNRTVISPLGGWPEELETLGAENPAGWVAFGYPAENLKTPEHLAFMQAYRKQFPEDPLRTSAPWGYSMIHALAEAVKKAGSLDQDQVARAMSGLSWKTPLGTLSLRALDHRCTLGTWVGRIAVENGQGVLLDPVYKGGEDYLPSPELVAKFRPKD